jgi:glycine cleavage system H protein
VQPKDLLYAKTHEWVHVNRDGGQAIATVGISHFAVEALTDLVYLELPALGRQVTAGQSIGEIESVKAVSDLYSPVSGEIVEVNRGLPDHQGELKNLLTHAAYEKQCAEEGH